MWKLTASGLAAVLIVVAASTAETHSLKELVGQLGSREKYFQPIDKIAPVFELRDINGRTVRLDTFHDRVVVLHFIYTRCPDICPLHADRIADVQEMVNQTPMKDQVQFISITTDPENDTPEVLRGYGPAHGLDPVNWIFLTSGTDRPTATRALAKRYGHTFTKNEDNYYQLHSLVTHIIGRGGKWQGNFYGLKFAATNLVVFVNALVNDHHKPTEQNQRSFWERVRRLF